MTANMMNVDASIGSLLNNIGETKENLLNRSVSLYDILAIANDNGLGLESCRIVKLLNDRVKAAEEARIKVYWRTRWSSGADGWTKEHFNPSETPLGVEEAIAEMARAEAGDSEHYRGFDFVIVKSWDTDPNTALNKVSV